MKIIFQKVPKYLMVHVQQSMMIIQTELTLEVLNLTDLISLIHLPNAKMLVILKEIVDIIHIVLAMIVIVNVYFIENQIE